jgi:hypothetical protein
MTYAGRRRLRYGAALAVWFSLSSTACLDDAKSERDGRKSTGMDAGQPPGSDHDSGATVNDGEDAGSVDPTDGHDDSNDPESDPDAGADDSDPDPDPDQEPAPELVLGTAIEAGCSSSQAPAGGMCGGYYCGVDEATVTAAIDPDAKCGGDPAMACSGSLTTAVAVCAREVKSAMPFASNDALRPMIQTCVYEDDEFEAVPDDCLGCFLDVAACASDHCLFQCLAGDSEECDQCQLDNGCTLPVFTCGGLPSPF